MLCMANPIQQALITAGGFKMHHCTITPPSRFHLHIHKREITYRSVVAILVKKVEKERSVVFPNNLNRCGRASLQIRKNTNI